MERGFWVPGCRCLAELMLPGRNQGFWIDGSINLMSFFTSTSHMQMLMDEVSGNCKALSSSGPILLNALQQLQATAAADGRQRNTTTVSP